MKIMPDRIIPFEELKEKAKEKMQAKSLAAAINNPEDPKARQVAREYAYNFAQNTPGLGLTVDPSDLENSIKLDNYMNAAIEFTSNYVNTLFDDKREQIIHSAPEEGLVKLIGYLSPVEIDGNLRHNEIARKHKKYSDWGELIQKIKEGKEDSRKLHERIAEYIENDIEEAFSKDPYMRDNKIMKDLILKVAYQSVFSNDRILSVVTQRISKGVGEEFNKAFKDERDKVVYARETLMAEKEKEKAIRYLEAIVAQAA